MCHNPRTYIGTEKSTIRGLNFTKGKERRFERSRTVYPLYCYIIYSDDINDFRLKFTNKRDTSNRVKKDTYSYPVKR